MKKGEGATLGIWLDRETKGEIERIADRIGISPSQLGKNLILVRLQEAQTMEKLGILQAAVMFQELRERIKKRVDEEGEKFGGHLRTA